MMPRGLFVTGTDTEVGKTVASVALLHALAGAGIRAAAMKPVASGSERTAAGLRNADALALQSAAGLRVPYEAVNPYPFGPAIAPHIAAREAGVRIGFDRILDGFEALSRGADLVLVEGVGGWRVPLGPDGDVARLARLLDLPVVLVVAVGLGCISHARLTAESIQACGARLAGWIANFPRAGGARLEDQLQTLESCLPAPCLGRLPWSREPLDASLGRAIDVGALTGESGREERA
ncbi:MAG TPA: dethiobiotin synthase [Gammaproteobacteria bacterium]|nr:dethiobiotin synthase [Gammaproteobacteria bacterium]